MGFDISYEQNEQLKGTSRADSLQKVLSWGNKIVSQAEFDRLMDNKNQDYLSQISSMKEDDLLLGVKNFLNFLSSRNISLALGSASKNARFILEKLKISDRFKAIVDGNDVSKPKPNLEVFLMAAEKLYLNPEECMIFEDSIAGIRAANAAGMTSIGIGDKEILHEADYNFQNSAEISTDFLEKLLH